MRRDRGWQVCYTQRADCVRIPGCAGNAGVRTGSSVGRVRGCHRPRCGNTVPDRCPGSSSRRRASTARIRSRVCNAGSSAPACGTTICRRSGQWRGDRPPLARCPACSDRGNPRDAHKGRGRQGYGQFRGARRRARVGFASFPLSVPGNAPAHARTRANARRLSAWACRLRSPGTTRWRDGVELRSGPQFLLPRLRRLPHLRRLPIRGRSSRLCWSRAACSCWRNPRLLRPIRAGRSVLWRRVPAGLNRRSQTHFWCRLCARRRRP